MRSTTYGTGQFSGHSSHFTGSRFIAAIVAKWQDYRMMRDLESMPYSVMKDIGFRSAEHKNAK
ncbi:hypothetical protein IHQ71_14095 [Rhizobium sp. TH2]|uniref:hypothetical protein n=1 Tax=Rhizobium sp. TH2 TaxID=2775403 RepID=UPI0021585048|nr:hypothetical protein [Rhizobium sp. TH2]UVC11613.1 hypothetical protein IHQ71_14095 [Rhizobium sp. TH2]